MDIIDFNTSFSLLEELEIASKFICKGLDELNRLEFFTKNEDLFHVFYSLSVGIERFQKSLLLLLWDIDETNAEEYEGKLITHSLNELDTMIRSIKPYKFPPQDNALIGLLQHFYISMRYFRYTVSKYHDLTEKSALDKYLFEQYEIHSLPEDPHQFFYEIDEERIKKMIGKSVSRICTKYNSLIKEIVSHQNHPLNELCYQPNYARLFCFESDGQSSSSNNAEMMQLNQFTTAVEAIIFLVNTESGYGHLNYLKELEPLDLDVAFTADYINCLAKGQVSLCMMEEVSACYEELESVEERLKSIHPVFSPNICFYSDMENEED